MHLKILLQNWGQELKNNLQPGRAFQMNGSNKDNLFPPVRAGTQKDRRRGQAGQVLIESLLLMVLSVGLLGVTLQYFRDTQTFSRITNAVWAGVAQMAEYGNWPGASTPVHPNSSIRARLRDPQ